MKVFRFPNKVPVAINITGTIIGIIDSFTLGNLLLYFWSTNKLASNLDLLYIKYEKVDPIITKIKARIPPIIIRREKFSNLRLDAAASGPGVGGTNTWGAKRLVERATPRDFNGIFDFSEIDFMVFERIMKAASQKGWLNEKKIVMEALACIKRAGATAIITYYAKEVLKWMK